MTTSSNLIQLKKWKRAMPLIPNNRVAAKTIKIFTITALNTMTLNFNHCHHMSQKPEDANCVGKAYFGGRFSKMMSK